METIPSLAMTRLPQRSLSSQSIGKYWQLNQNNHKDRTEHIQMQTNATQKGALINSNTLTTIILRDRTDRACFSRILRHLARKRRVSTLSTRGSHIAASRTEVVFSNYQSYDMSTSFALKIRLDRHYEHSNIFFTGWMPIHASQPCQSK